MSISVDSGVNEYSEYLLTNKRPNTVKSYNYTLDKFRKMYSGMDITAVRGNDVFKFLETLTKGQKQSTKAHRAGQISSLFNFIGDVFELEISNPCAKGIIKKLYKTPHPRTPVLLDKEIIDEIIYRTDGRDRLILDLMAKSAMRIGEVLTTRVCDLNIDLNTISIANPKSGREGEVAPLHQKLMRSLEIHVQEKAFPEDGRIFPISYTTAYRMVVKRGKTLGVKLAPHDLRRHAATQASRAGKPLQWISQCLLRHANIATTERYLGRISPAESNMIMESMYG